MISLCCRLWKTGSMKSRYEMRIFKIEARFSGKPCHVVSHRCDPSANQPISDFIVKALGQDIKLKLHPFGKASTKRWPFCSMKQCMHLYLKYNHKLHMTLFMCSVWQKVFFFSCKHNCSCKNAESGVFICVMNKNTAFMMFTLWIRHNLQHKPNYESVFQWF